MTATTASVALATCRDARGLPPDERALIPALADRGIAAEVAVWDDPAVDWNAFDLTVVRSTFDFAARRDEFVAWAKSVSRIENPARVIEWNTDRIYLRELYAADVPVIDTIWLDPAAHLSPRAIHSRMPAFGDFVVKPVVSAGSEDIGRYQPVSAASRTRAIAHARRLLDSGRAVMIQPYVASIDVEGEANLIFVNDQFQHAVRRKALLGGTHRETVGLSLYAGEGMAPVEVTDAQLEVAQRAIAAAHDACGSQEPFLYARVDLVNGGGATIVGANPKSRLPEGPLVIELELTEPSLWFRHSGGHPTLANFADAIAAKAIAAKSTTATARGTAAAPKA